MLRTKTSTRTPFVSTPWNPETTEFTTAVSTIAIRELAGANQRDLGLLLVTTLGSPITTCSTENSFTLPVLGGTFSYAGHDASPSDPDSEARSSGHFGPARGDVLDSTQSVLVFSLVDFSLLLIRVCNMAETRRRSAELANAGRR